MGGTNGTNGISVSSGNTAALTATGANSKSMSISQGEAYSVGGDDKLYYSANLVSGSLSGSLSGSWTLIDAGTTWKQVSLDSGVVAINLTQVLCRDSNDVWKLVTETNNVLHYDLSQARRSLKEQISESANQLAASDLVGDETKILAALESFRTLHIPPHISKRSTEALELAARIIIIAQGAIANTSALHSPSTDRRRLQTLEQLITVARTVLQSVVTT